MELEYRNPKWFNKEHTHLNVEINHPELGWIPYTTSEDDTGIGSQIWEIRDTIEIEEYQEPITSFEDALKEKLHEVSWKSDLFEQSKCDKMFVNSSFGFRANADRRSQQNIEGLIKVLGENKTRFKDYDNNFHELGVEELKILLVECIQNGLYLYEQKFQMQEILNNMTDIEEIKVFEVDYKMLDFNS